MEKELNKPNKIYEERKEGIKILADQMARRCLGFDDKELKDSYLTEKLMKKMDNLNNIKENETEYQSLMKKYNQIQENNSNIITNINTKENNQNTAINTIINTGTNQNTIPNNINENEFISNIYTKRSQDSMNDEKINDYESSSEKKSEGEFDISIRKISKDNSGDFSDNSSEKKK